jgi:hypothetical protein
MRPIATNIRVPISRRNIIKLVTVCVGAANLGISTPVKGLSCARSLYCNLLLYLSREAVWLRGRKQRPSRN